MIISVNVNFLDSDCNIVNCGQKNMELDLKMLSDAISNRHDFISIRFYNWSPKCISLGKNQKYEEYFDDLGIDIVRRPTGGRALLHDKELTYCLVSPIKNGQSVIESYREVSDGLILGFEKLGIKLDYAGEKGKNMSYCMNISSGADVSYNGRKLIGSAQFRSQGYFLQHGSIMYSADFDLIEKIFRQKVNKEAIVTLGEIDSSIKQNDLISALKEGFLEKFKIS